MMISYYDWKTCHSVLYFEITLDINLFDCLFGEVDGIVTQMCIEHVKGQLI